jgi:hypothetical protein
LAKVFQPEFVTEKLFAKSGKRFRTVRRFHAARNYRKTC